ncbi:MAG TPA: hypothetical protein VM184_06800 [Gaiellaceae bacterium]|nr:hypothetical protein [Gaiellaceae bacterium]
MKLKTLLLALFTAGLAASFAVAGQPPAPREGKMPAAAQEKASAAKDKGKERAKAAKAKAAKAKAARLGAKEEANVLDGCRPRVAFILQGEFVSSSAGAEGTTLVAMLVKRGNAHAKRYAGKQVTVTVGDRTRVIRRGPAEASDLAAGDRLLVHVRGCKSADETMELYAKHVVAKPAAKDEDEDDEDETTTSTTTATDTTTTTTTTP